MQIVNSSLKYTSCKSTNNRGVRIWNEIDHSIREMKSFSKFKLKIKQEMPSTY